MLIVGPALLAPFISHGRYSGNLEPSRVLADDFFDLSYARRYRIEMTSPLRSAATISPAWRPDNVSTAPF